MKAIRDATPQALHHFTLSNQVNVLVEASEADPDLGFMARVRRWRELKKIKLSWPGLAASDYRIRQGARVRL